MVSWLAVAEFTVALVSPKKMMLSVGLLLKLDPLIVTVVPIAPLVGVNEDIIGTWANKLLLLKMIIIAQINLSCFKKQVLGMEVQVIQIVNG